MIEEEPSAPWHETEEGKKNLLDLINEKYYFYKDGTLVDATKSEFYHFGILPDTCIHSIVEDEYSKMYMPQERCACGCLEWLTEGCKMILFIHLDGTPIYKDVHRCKNCGEVRLAYHIGTKEHDS